MYGSDELFLKVYTASVLGNQCNLTNLSDEQWSELYRISLTHGAAALVYPIIDRIATVNEKQQSIKDTWKKNFKIYFIRQSMIYDELKKTVEILYNNNIFPVLLKGPYLARFYPEPSSRISSDIDFLLKKDKAEQAEKVLQKSCSTKIISKSESTYTYIINDVLHIEIHLTAFAENQGKFFKRFSDYGIFSEEKMCKADILNTPFTVPDCSDMFIYLVCHMAQHLVANGFGIRQVSDFALFLKHYNDQFDMNYINGILNKLELYAFAQNCIYICVKYFDVTDDFIETDNSKLKNTSELLLNDILSGGLFGYSSEERRQSGFIVKEAYQSNNNSKKKSKLWGIITKFFPPYSVMKRRYKYCEICPLLLPAAWINRIFEYIKTGKGKKTNYIKSIKNISDIAQNRKNLLRELEMM